MSSPDDNCPTHNTRSTIQIVWSCLFIIFTCTWTAIHPNVPPPQVSSSKWKKLWWRLKIMLWTLMVPEMMVSWATYQWGKARKISTEASKQSTISSLPVGHDVGAHEQSSGVELALITYDASAHMSSSATNENYKPSAKWTRTHSYFLLMGGFAILDSEDEDSWTPIQPWDISLNLATTLRFWLAADAEKGCSWPRIKEADILNVTKGEALAKIIVVLQVIWFVSQLCGRVVQHLAITELEIMTLAYAIICAMLYMLWFSKPYNMSNDQSSWVIQLIIPKRQHICHLVLFSSCQGCGFGTYMDELLVTLNSPTTSLMQAFGK
ncbi:hypothetical protein ONZ45_g9102 [Pleurotus djamor]|nr:hypothetical protein ONZ45_g9102 [Pleurotus djamor]